MSTSTTIPCKDTIQNSETFTLTLCGISSTVTVYKANNICYLHFDIGDGTVFSSATGTDLIGTIPEGFRPSIGTAQVMIDARTDGTWKNAAHYISIIQVHKNGNVTLICNTTEIQKCRYVTGDLWWIC